MSDATCATDGCLALDYMKTIEGLEAENVALRRDIDNIKVRSYELGQRELHDMALAALTKGEL